MYALLGDIFFQTLTSPEQLRMTTDFHYAEHKIVEAPPRLQWLANELKKISLDMGFHIQFTNPATQMNHLHTVAEAHRANALVYGNGVFVGYFVIESIEETQIQQADDGSFIAMSARVELKEWVPGMDFDPFAPARLGTKPAGIVDNTPALTPLGFNQQKSGNALTPQPFDPTLQIISQTNPLSTSDVVSLRSDGATGGVTYSAADYSKPGVSGIVGGTPTKATPGVIGNVNAMSIVRSQAF
jgi:phage protein U